MEPITLRTADDITATLAKEFYNSRDFLFLGRGIHYPIAEGALKLKEISYTPTAFSGAVNRRNRPFRDVTGEAPVGTVSSRRALYFQPIHAKGDSMTP